MPIADMDFSTNYCTVCDVAHERGGLYCSLKCQKRDAKAANRSPTKASIDTMSALMVRSRSSLSLYAQSNPSSTSLNSNSNTRSDSIDVARDSGKGTRPPLDRRLSAQRPLPPVKKNSYSSSVPKSLDLVTPILTPLTKKDNKASPVASEFMYPVQPAGTRFNHLSSDAASSSDQPRRMFFFKRVQSDDEVPQSGDDEARRAAQNVSRSVR